MSKLSYSVVSVLGFFVFACGGGPNGNDGGTDASNSDAAQADAASDAPKPIDAGKNDASPALVAQCQTQANNFATLCAGDDIRPCLWGAYAQLCESGQTQLLVDSMNCLDQNTCRTFSDANGGVACLDTTHSSEESISSRNYITTTCNTCGNGNCVDAAGVAEIFPYLTDADIAALSSCQGNACDINAVIQSCAATIPDIALFLACVQ